MTWRLEWHERALQDVERLDRRTRERIVGALERLAETGHGDVIPLRGRQREWRLRVGQWRALFTIDEANERIVVLRVLPRGRAYRR
jgi:mRNA-degrading endonuclease RelE of RelBE toxin-antitoxin system